MRDPKKLRVFQKADAAVVDVYRVTRKFPVEERYGLQAQIRMAAVSVANTLIEGCAVDDGDLPPIRGHCCRLGE